MNYVIKEGCQLNPNEKIVKGITKMLERNEGLCPCVHPEPCEDLHCPCSDYIKNDKCCCKLYIKNGRT